MAESSSPGSTARAPTHLALLPLAIGFILFATALPVELRAAAGWSLAFRFEDFLANVLLFLPLGIGLSRGRPLLVALAALTLSGAVETLQLWEMERFVSPWDLLANMLGAVAGALAWRTIPRARSIDLDRIGLGTRELLVLWIFIATVLALWGRPSRSSSLAFWHPNFPLQLGNEHGGGRPWKGTISSLSLLATAPSDGTFGPSGQAILEPHDSVGDIIYSVDTLVRLAGPAAALPQSVGATLARRVMMTEALTVIARIAPANIVQRGPARIISFSDDTLHRNFDLGQEGAQLVFRVATPVSGENGNDFRAESFPDLVADRTVTVMATYDGEVSRIYVDGKLTGRSNLAAAGCAVRAMCDTAAPLVWCLLGASIALTALYFRRIRGVGSVLTALPAGLFALLLPWLPPVSSGPMRSHPALALWALLGIGMVGWSACRALRAPAPTLPA